MHFEQICPAIVLCSLWCLISLFNTARASNNICCLRNTSLLNYVRATSLNSDKCTKFRIISYITSNIVDYGQYAIAINSMYAMSNGIGFSFQIDSDQFANEVDQRWNKVKMLSKAIMDSCEQTEFVLWMDADLAVIDWNFDIDKIVNNYTWADIIVSKDARPENGIANTGCIIVKNSIWSRQFLHLWWEAYDRTGGMDQHVFEKLWRGEGVSNSLDAQNHIALLSIDALNSHIPAYVHQQRDNQILHLAGASNRVRRDVFKQGFDEICRCMFIQSADGESSSDELLLPGMGFKNCLSRQLTLTREELSRHHHDLAQDIIQLTLTLGKLKSLSLSNIDAPEMLIEIAHDLQDLKQNDVLISSPTGHKMIANCLEMIYGLWRSHVSVSQSLGDSSALVTTYQELLDAAFNYVIFCKDIVTIRVVLSDLTPFVDNLLQHSNFSPGAWYYKFKFHTFWSELERKQSQIPGYMSAHRILSESQQLWLAWRAWEQLHQLHFYGSGNQVADPFKEGAEITARLAVLSRASNCVQECLSCAAQTLMLVKSVWGNQLQLFLHQNQSNSVPFHTAVEYARTLLLFTDCGLRAQSLPVDSNMSMKCGTMTMPQKQVINMSYSMSEHLVTARLILTRLNLSDAPMWNELLDLEQLWLRLPQTNTVDNYSSKSCNKVKYYRRKKIS